MRSTNREYDWQLPLALGEVDARVEGRGSDAGPVFIPAEGSGTRGIVVGLQRSSGGVPKLPVASAEVNENGMEGDRQNDRRFHGGPQRALCLYSLERLDALVAEGHQAVPGALGENVTISGLAWDDVRPGVRLRLGAVIAEVTAFTPPCRKIARVFSEGDFTRIAQKRQPGWSRVYVRILRPGRITVGDEVSLASP